MEAVAVAAAVLQSYARVENPEAVTYAVISAWIIQRMKISAGKRIADTVVFDLNDAKIRGMVSAILPKIADELEKAEFPFGKTFSELNREEALDLFHIGCIGYRDAAVAAGEAPDFPFSDAIPFGEAAE